MPTSGSEEEEEGGREAYLGLEKSFDLVIQQEIIKFASNFKALERTLLVNALGCFAFAWLVR